jgi:hypothetical protein
MLTRMLKRVHEPEERGNMKAVLNPLTSFESAAKVFETAATSVFVTSVVLLKRYVRK